jgi:hypothetical protein
LRGHIVRNIQSIKIYGEIPPAFSKELTESINAAKRLMTDGYKVYLLPNPKDISSADLIAVKNDNYKMYELKTVYGKNSIGNRLESSEKQSEYVLLNIISSIPARTAYESIKQFFSTSKKAKEVLIFKGNKEFVITKSKIKQKDFLYYLIKEWEK